MFVNLDRNCSDFVNRKLLVGFPSSFKCLTVYLKKSMNLGNPGTKFKFPTFKPRKKKFNVIYTRYDIMCQIVLFRIMSSLCYIDWVLLMGLLRISKSLWVMIFFFKHIAHDVIFGAMSFIPHTTCLSAETWKTVSMDI